jgi:hypothetical protein
MQKKVLPHSKLASKYHIIVHRQINEVVMEEVEISSLTIPVNVYVPIYTTSMLSLHRFLTLIVKSKENFLKNHIFTLII